MKDSKIEWTDHTFNPWIGCTRVSPGCVNCYAETLMDKRLGQVKWGVGQPRKRTHERNWNAVRKWNNVEIGQCPKCGLRKEAGWRGAHAATCNHCPGPVHLKPARPRVFCASLADWLDPEVPVEWLADLLALIHECPNLDFLLLTKRPGLWRERLTDAGKAESMTQAVWQWLCQWTEGNPPANVWIGTTVEDQRRADERIPDLLAIPARVRFLSCEPLLGPVNLEQFLWAVGGSSAGPFVAQSGRRFGGGCGGQTVTSVQAGEINWVICGGESGPNARPMHPDWARSLRDQCAAAGVPFFFKQWGEWAPGGIAGMHIPDCLGSKIDDASHYHYFEDDAPCKTWRVGKHRAGRLLDGREHSAFPEVRP